MLRRSDTPASSLRWPYVLGAAVVVALILLGAGLSTWESRLHARERSETAARNMAHLLEAQLVQSLDIVDQRLEEAGKDLISELTRSVAFEEAARRVEVEWVYAGGHGVLNGELRVLDRHGRQPGSAGAPVLSPQGLLRMTAAPGLGITPPDKGLFVTPAEADPVLWLTRTVEDGGGKVIALLMLGVPTAHLGRFFEGLELGEYGAATVRTLDMTLLYRRASAASTRPGGATPPPPGVGNRTVSQGLQLAIAARPGEGHYIATVPLDGIERSNAYRRVGRYPLYVIIGLATQDEMRGWRAQFAQTGALAGVSSLITVAMAAVLYRSNRRHLHDAQARFEAIVQSSPDAIISMSLDGQVTSWNPGAQAMYGYAPLEMVGQPLRKLLPPERLGEEDEVLGRLRRGEHVMPFETVRVHRDGHRIDVSVSLSPLRDESGQIVGASKIARDISRQKRMEAEVRELAFLDALTRLPNRRLLTDRLHQAQANSIRRREHAAVLFIDLDGFKAINDQHGHEAGDLLLVDVAHRLRRAVRESDTVARLGGDEFVLVCEGLGAEREEAEAHARVLVGKLREILAEPSASGLPACTGSVGVHVFLGAEDSPEGLIRAADHAMYRDKSQKRTESTLASTL